MEAGDSAVISVIGGLVVSFYVSLRNFVHCRVKSIS
jgi:hypothetical protein